MNPFPLTRPDGIVHAWACGRCGIVGGSGTWRGNNGVESEFNCVRPEESKQQAERCCVCDCGAPVDRSVVGIGCAACNERLRVEREARAAEPEETDETPDPLAPLRQSDDVVDHLSVLMSEFEVAALDMDEVECDADSVRSLCSRARNEILRLRALTTGGAP